MPNLTSTPGIARSSFYILKRDVKKTLKEGDLVSLMTNLEFTAWARVMEVEDLEYRLMLDTTDDLLFVQDLEVLDIVESHEAEVKKELEDEDTFDGENLLYARINGKDYYINLDEWEEFQEWKNKHNI